MQLYDIDIITFYWQAYCLLYNKCEKLLWVVTIMFKGAGRYFFLLVIYLSGILIGGIYTPKVIYYAKQVDQYENIEKQKIQQKAPRIKKQDRVGIHAV